MKLINAMRNLTNRFLKAKRDIIFNYKSNKRFKQITLWEVLTDEK